MSVILRCTYRPEFDRYATTKSGGQFLLSAGLLADNITEIIFLTELGTDREPYYYPLLGILITCIVLNTFGLLTSLVLGVMTYPIHTPYDTNMVAPGDPTYVNPDTTGKEKVPAKCPRGMKIVNDLLTISTGMMFILVATKNSVRQGPKAYTTCDTCPNGTKPP